MRMQGKTAAMALAFLIASSVAGRPPLQAETPATSLAELDNGLELAYLQAGAPSWVSLRAVFRAGAIAQTSANAGIFAVHASLLSEGNAAYPDAARFKEALSALGASAWEARATEEFVSFGFTVPAPRLGEGLDFLAQALASPSFPAAAVEEAKKKAADRVASAAASPDAVFKAAMTARLFPRNPQRRDPVGSPAGIASIDAAGLRAIHGKYFLPNNCVLVASGGLSAAEFEALARPRLGSWKRGEDPWKTPLAAHPLPPVKRPTWLVFEDAGLAEGSGVIEMRYRGPELLSDPKGMFAALVFQKAVSAPGSPLKNSIAKSVPGIADRERITVEVPLSRDGGQIVLRADFAPSAALPAWQFAMMRFKEQVRGIEFEGMRRDPTAYFGKEALAAAKASLGAAPGSEAESPAGFLASYSRIWSAGSAAAYADWEAQAAAQDAETLRAFVFKYFSKNLELVALRLSPADYARESKAAIASGFAPITPENAFWWSMRK